ncbi:MAG: non-homologous end-joining DNA ligase [Candidatus Binataceae bacterium]
MANTKLSTYRAKRDFSKTAEPSGAAAIASSHRLRYVIQKHAASRLHYDFRLELDGVMKSWAVTRGPSIDPHDKRLAVEVEDHPLDYGDFEGVIAAGQYGGGTVQLWDRGYWTPEDGITPQAAFKAGNLKFTLDGERLHGSWVLVRMKHDRSGGKRTNWLLIKHRDEFAHEGDNDAILAEDRSVASSRTMAAIAAGNGRGPKPFILKTARKAKADAVWSSNHDGMARDAGTAKKSSIKTKPAKSLKPAAPGDAVVMGVTISKPDKALWPDDGKGQPITKLDLARYYEAVGPHMIQHLKGRPCSIVRGPNGVDGEHFFQRHPMAGSSKLFARVKVAGITEPYMQIDQVEALAEVAKMAGLELHPWNCQPGQPEIPGRLVFDLDPSEDVAFAAVIKGAREVHDRLEALGLVSFCKTTGGKGLHVVTPLAQEKKDRLDWATAKSFAHEVCLQMAADSPSRYLTKMAKKDRGGKIFLDYLRNDRMATAVAPLSTRARAGAPVSMPLLWTQLRSGLDPKRFTIRTVPRLIAKSNAWHDYCASERPLSPAIKQLNKAKAA